MAGGHKLSRADFKALEKSASVRLNGTHFSLRATPLPAAKTARFACVVSKRVSPKATTRNLVKRRCRAAALPRVRALAKPVAVVLTAKRSAAGAPYADIERDIEYVLSRV